MSELNENELSTQQPEQPVVENEPAPAQQPETAEKGAPKWTKIVELVSIICIAAAGLLSALFLCLLSYKEVAMSMDGWAPALTEKSYMFSDVVKSMQEAVKALADDINSSGDVSIGGLANVMAQVLYDAYVMIFMLVGIIAGIVLGIMLIIKCIQHFAMKRESTLEKTAITACLFFFATAIIVLNMAMFYMTDGKDVMGVKTYGGATVAGLVICGILFALYFVGKIVANYKNYLGDRNKLINGCFNLGWAVVAMLVLAILSCAPIVASIKEMGESLQYGYGFNYLFSDAFGQVIKKADGASTEMMKELANQYAYSALGMLIFVWFVYQSGKSLHGAMRGVASAEKTVKLGSQIWRLVFSVLYLIICVVLSKEVFPKDSGMKVSLAAPVVILVFSIIGLVLAIVNKILVADKVEKKEI